MNFRRDTAGESLAVAGPEFRPGPACHPQTRRTHHPPLRHRRSQPQFTTLPCPCGRIRVLADEDQMPMLGLGVWQVPNGAACVNVVRWALDLATGISTRLRSMATRRASDARCAIPACRAARCFLPPSSIPGASSNCRGATIRLPQPSRASGGSASTKLTSTSFTGPCRGARVVVTSAASSYLRPPSRSRRRPCAGVRRYHLRAPPGRRQPTARSFAMRSPGLSRRWQRLLELLVSDPRLPTLRYPISSGRPLAVSVPTRGRCLAQLRLLQQEHELSVTTSTNWPSAVSRFQEDAVSRPLVGRSSVRVRPCPSRAWNARSTALGEEGQ